jgi:colanic acid biosynthesis glycosyl transferase WcaI
MRVIVWGINYAPEVTGIAPYNVMLCEFLRADGHDVEMVTTFPYYPMWRKRAEDRGALYRTNTMNDVRVHRCWHYVPAQVSSVKRILHEGTFVLTSLLRVLSLARADVYVVVSPPLLLGAAASLVAWLKGRPLVFHVQDLQPDAAVGLGMLRTGWFTRALYALERLAYRNAARVSGIGAGMLQAFRDKGVPESKIVYFPNGIDLPRTSDIPAPGAFRALHAFRADEFLAIYSGNLGVKQGLGVLLEAAEFLQGSSVRIVICGDGAARPSLEAQVRRRNLQNVTMLPLQETSVYASLLVDADVCLITQMAGSGSAFFPSKLLSALAFGKPIVSVADAGSALAVATAEGGFGVNVSPHEAESLAHVLRDLAANPARLHQFSTAGRAFVSQFEKTTVLRKFVDDLSATVADPRPRDQ